MEILIVILIVAVIVQTGVTIYDRIVNDSASKIAAANTEMLKTSQASFAEEKHQFHRYNEIRDKQYEAMQEKIENLQRENYELHKVNGLLQSRTMCLDALKDSFNEVAENAWDLRETDQDRMNYTPRQWFVDGMKEGAEWITLCVGCGVKFEIDNRHKGTVQCGHTKH